MPAVMTIYRSTNKFRKENETEQLYHPVRVHNWTWRNPRNDNLYHGLARTRKTPSIMQVTKKTHCTAYINAIGLSNEHVRPNTRSRRNQNEKRARCHRTSLFPRLWQHYHKFRKIALLTMSIGWRRTSQGLQHQLKSDDEDKQHHKHETK